MYFYCMSLFGPHSFATGAIQATETVPPLETAAKDNTGGEKDAAAAEDTDPASSEVRRTTSTTPPVAH
jgi:hypothetical protein